MNLLMLPDIDQMFEDHFRPRVEKGCAYLDECHEGWAQKINPANLNMTDGAICICGWVFEDYSNRPAAILHGDQFGFNVGDRDVPQGYLYDGNVTQAAWRALERLWLDEVFWRTGEQPLFVFDED